MRKILVLGGPTGSGKNRAALEVARRFPVEIVNADSRQIYRGLPIGTNQPSTREMKEVPHHLYGFLEPDRDFSVAEYERLVVPLLSEISQRGKTPLIVGGTGFYIRAILKGVWQVPKHDPELRQRLRRILGKRGKDRLHALLRRVDPISAAQIPPNDSYRVIRSLEIYFQTGSRRSEIKHEEQDRFPAAKYFLDLPSADLAMNIQKRTDQMFDSGWVEEVCRLTELYPGFDAMPAARSLGYPEILLFLKKRISLEDCESIVVRKTLQYAKRQRTWFRNQDRFEPFSSAEELHKKVDFVLQ